MAFNIFNIIPAASIFLVPDSLSLSLSLSGKRKWYEGRKVEGRGKEEGRECLYIGRKEEEGGRKEKRRISLGKGRKEGRKSVNWGRKEEGRKSDDSSHSLLSVYVSLSTILYHIYILYMIIIIL